MYIRNPTGQPVRVWNDWLKERERAPADVLADWIKEKTQGGLEVAKEYAWAGLEAAKARADVVRQGRALLDEGGERVQEAIQMKQICARAVAADADILQRLRYFSTAYMEEASFSTDPVLKNMYAERARLYDCALRELGEPPAAPHMTPVERDAAAILQFRLAKDRVSRTLSLASASESGGYLSGPPSGTEVAEGLMPRRSLEDLMAELFRLQDLDGNGFLEEEELVKLNEKITLLHKGTEMDKAAVRAKCKEIFRTKLDPEGRPVPYAAFSQHMFQVIRELDPNEQAQEMMLEQFIAEAEAGREAFRHESLCSASDAAFLSKLWPSHAAGHGRQVPIEQTASLPQPDHSSEDSVHHLAAHSCTDRVQTASSLSDASFAAYTASSEVRQRMVDGAAGKRPVVGSSMQNLTGGALPQHAAVQQAPVQELGRRQMDHRTDMPRQQPETPTKRIARSKCMAANRTAEKEVEEQKQAMRPCAEDARDSDSDSVGSFVPEPREEIERGFSKGDRLQIWSNTRGLWLDGAVEEAFPVACEAEGYSIPAGTLKVRSAAGVKWIMPGQAASVLRRHLGPGVP